MAADSTPNKAHKASSKGLEEAENVFSKMVGNLEGALRPVHAQKEEEKPRTGRFGPAAGMGVGFGAGAGIALVGCSALEPTTSFTQFKVVFGIGAGFGVGIGYGFGIGVGKAWKASELLGGTDAEADQEAKQ
eukprot:jgi/Pico_ML_1/52616/g3296.t1